MLSKTNWLGSAIAATLFAMSLIGSFAAFAETRATRIRVAGEDIRADESKARSLFARIETLIPLNKERKKAYAAIEAQFKELQSRLDALNALWLDHQRMLADQAKLAEAQTKRCAAAARGEPNRLCAREKDQIAARQAELDRITERTKSERQATESALSAKLEEHAALAVLLGATIEEQELAQMEYVLLYQRVQALRKELAGLCAASETSAEAAAISACADLGWESRTKVFTHLPPLPRLSRSKKDN